MNDNDFDDWDSHTYRLTWEGINEAATDVAAHISDNYDIDGIVCTQFDVIPASLVAKKLKLPVCIIHPESRQNGIVIDCIPQFNKPIRSGEYYQPKPKIAIISTLIDNSNNVDGLVGFYRDNSAMVISLFSRKDVTNPPAYQAVLLAGAVNPVFPWEEK